MKVTLLNTPNPKFSAKQQVLFNRGIRDINGYLNTTDADICDYNYFGKDKLMQGMTMIFKAIKEEYDFLVVVDADCDGITSSALLINYLYALFPSFVSKHLHYFLHEGKQHGLSDCIQEAMKYKLVIIPDAGSNDYEQHQMLVNNGTDVLILDHHEADKESNGICLINNQMCDYPNKNLSGAGVVWQFCRFIDDIIHNDKAKDFIDLAALGVMADMMDLREFETKHLIFKGFKRDNIHNPFIRGMINKNEYSLNKGDYKPSFANGLQVSPIGSAFYIAPFINAMVRSGKMEEKDILFRSMLTMYAFDDTDEMRYNKKTGNLVPLWSRGVQVCEQVKRRQTKAETDGLERLEYLIKENDMDKHKVFLFLLEPGEVDKNIAGLIANKFMAKYQRPVAILTKMPDGTYQGSARGYDAGGVTNFKDICAAAPGCVYAAGHQGAFGLGLAANQINEYLEYTDEVLKDMSTEPSYFVDYIWHSNSIEGDKILEIADMNDYIGKGMERSYVMIRDIEITEQEFKVMKSNTLKFSTGSNVDIIKFSGTEDEIDLFQSGDTIVIDAICKCAANEWQGNIRPQLMMVDYEITDVLKQSSLSGWGF